MSIISELLYNTFEIVKSECSSHSNCTNDCKFYNGDIHPTCPFSLNPEYWDCDTIKNICYDIRYR